MSRSIAQKSDRSKNLIIVNTAYPGYGEGYLQISAPADFEYYLESVTKPYTVTGNVYSTATLDDMIAGSGGLYSRVEYSTDWFYDDMIGTVLRDLGKTIEFKVDGSLFARWNLVQMVNGTVEESQSGENTDTFYITTFYAYPSSEWEVVGVARLG